MGPIAIPDQGHLLKLRRQQVAEGKEEDDEEDDEAMEDSTQEQGESQEGPTKIMKYQSMSMHQRVLQRGQPFWDHIIKAARFVHNTARPLVTKQK